MDISPTKEDIWKCKSIFAHGTKQHRDMMKELEDVEDRTFSFLVNYPFNADVLRGSIRSLPTWLLFWTVIFNCLKEEVYLQGQSPNFFPKKSQLAIYRSH